MPGLQYYLSMALRRKINPMITMKRIWRTLRNLGPPFFEPNQISSSFLFISYLMTVHRAGMNRLDLRAA